jgi:hypothetical protein
MTTRRLAAILAADVVGFSSMMEKDEEGTLARIKTLEREVIEPKVRERGGRLVKTRLQRCSYEHRRARILKGVYQHCAEKHLHRYLAEFEFRYNHRTALGVSDHRASA